MTTTTNPIIQASSPSGLIEDNDGLVENSTAPEENAAVEKPKLKNTAKAKVKVHSKTKAASDSATPTEVEENPAIEKPKPETRAKAKDKAKVKTKASSHSATASADPAQNAPDVENPETKASKQPQSQVANRRRPNTSTPRRNQSLLQCLYYQIFYSSLAKKYFKVLIFQAIPVFIAAAFSGFVMSLIRYLADDEEEGSRADSECIQALAYSLITYISGYFLTVGLKQALERKEQPSWIVWLEQRQLTGIIFGIFAESSGFAWREFVNTFVLKIIYLRYGWGEALGAWLLMIFVFSLFSFLSGMIMNTFLFSSPYKELIIEYNSDSFALPLAFSITVLWAVGCGLLGENYVDQTGYLFEWKDDDNETSNFVMNPFYYLYVLSISFIVSLLLVVEDRFCLPWFHEAERRIEAEDPRQHSEQMIPFDKALEEGWNSFDDRKTFQQNDVSHLEAVLEMWHGFLGCLVGVAYYAMIMDGYLTSDNALIGVVVSLFFGLVLAWRGPACVAHAASKQKIYQEEYLKEKQRNEQTGRNGRKDAIGAFCEWSNHISMHRRGTSVIAFSLITGWMWETFISKLLELIADSDSLDSGSTVAVDFAVFVCAVIVAFMIQFLVKGLGIEDISEEEESITVGALEAKNKANQSITPVTTQTMTRT